MKKKLKLNFVDFSGDFTSKNNYFLNLLENYYDIEISNDPDILFYSNFGYEHLKYQCKKIFYSGENNAPNYFFCDYAFSFHDTDEKNFFLPHFVEFEYFFNFKNDVKNEEIEIYKNTKKEKFCNFMASNYKAKERINFVKALMKRKKVDCLGPVLYNMEISDNVGKLDHTGEYIDWRKEKFETIKEYKFTMAFENEQAYNYVTEKIYQPLVVGSIPIYWGAPNVDTIFNPKCFVNVNNFNSYEEAIDEIIKIDEDKAYYETFFEEPAILIHSKLIDLSEKQIIERINTVILRDKEPVGHKYRSTHRILYYILNTKLQIVKYIKNIIKKLIRRKVSIH